MRRLVPRTPKVEFEESEVPVMAAERRGLGVTQRGHRGPSDRRRSVAATVSKGAESGEWAAEGWEAGGTGRVEAPLRF